MAALERYMIGGLAVLIVAILSLSLQRTETRDLAGFLVVPPEEVTAALDEMDSVLVELDGALPSEAARARLDPLRRELQRLRLAYVEQEEDRRELKSSFDDFKLFSGVANAVNLVVLAGGFFVVRRRRKPRDEPRDEEGAGPEP